MDANFFLVFLEIFLILPITLFEIIQLKFET